jgi:hypothetical protein
MPRGEKRDEGTNRIVKAGGQQLIVPRPPRRKVEACDAGAVD